MTLAAPYFLIALVAVPLLLVVFFWQQRRRRRDAIRHPNVAMVKAAMGTRSSWKRYLPLALVLAALASMAFAAARPTVVTQVPRQRSSIIVALDVSRSMCAVDVEPNRLAAAKDALREFIEDQPDTTRIGIIAFAGYAEMVASPTTDKSLLMETVEGLTTGRGTTIGAAILKSIDAIASINPAVAPVAPDEARETPEQEQWNSPAPDLAEVEAPTTPPVSDIVVLLTDGANTRGVLPLDAAKIAGARGVRLYPIGFGTTDPTQMVCTADQLGGDAFGDGGGLFSGNGPDMAQFLIVDEPTMEAVAKASGGQYAPAEDRDELDTVLRDLPTDIVLATEEVELTAVVAGLAALFLLGAVVVATRVRTFP